jgi:hypothetical protein
MPTAEQQDLIDFIGPGGKLPVQLDVEFGPGYVPVLESLIRDGFVFMESIITQETAETPAEARQASGVVGSYRLTDEGIFALL